MGVTKIGGWLGIATAAAAWYASFGGVVNETFKRAIMPVGAAGPAQRPDARGSHPGVGSLRPGAGRRGTVARGVAGPPGCRAPGAEQGEDRDERHVEGGEALSALLHETRRFDPPPEFAAQANAQPGIYEEAAADPAAWWAEQAERLTWDHHWDQVLDWDLPFAKWFVGGRLNAAYNCVDRHVEAGRGDRVAFHWVGEPEGDTRTITYADLQRMVCQAANALVELGVEAGDRVAIYLPMIPEAVVAMLACARLGAPHSVVFGGFSAEALASRIARRRRPGGHHRRRRLPARRRVGRSSPTSTRRCAQCPDVRSVLVVRRTGQDVDWHGGPRRLVARPGRPPARHPRGGVLRRRAAALHHVHQRHHGQAQGHPPHHRRLPGAHGRPPTAWSSTSSPRRTSSGRRPTSAG